MIRNLPSIRSPWLPDTRQSVLLMLGFLLLLATQSPAQRPQFRPWNIGIVEGFSPLNANSALPTLSGSIRNWSLELSPYAFNPGAGLTYHSPVLKLFKKLNWTIDGVTFFARQNANYFVTFPRVMHMTNVTRTGLMAGASFYFLKRCALEIRVGAQYTTYYGPAELRYTADPRNFMGEAGAVALHIHLFNQFAQ